MITKKDLITDATLEADIKDLPKDFNTGRSKAIQGLFRLNDIAKKRRLKKQYAIHNSARRKSDKAYASGCANSMAAKNRALNYNIKELGNANKKV